MKAVFGLWTFRGGKMLRQLEKKKNTRENKTKQNKTILMCLILFKNFKRKKNVSQKSSFRLIKLD